MHAFGSLDQAFIDEHQLAYPIVDDMGRNIWDDYGMQFHPSWAFIGPDGSLVHRQVGVAILPEVVAYIEEALGSQ